MQQIKTNNKFPHPKTEATFLERAITIKPWMLPVVIWLALVCWRPLIVGFFHDDWVVLQPLLADDASRLLADQASRPIYAAIVIFARLVMPTDPFYYQVLLTVLLAFSALAIGVFAKRLANCVEADDKLASWSGAAAASMWLATPWNLGVSVWPTTFPAQFSVIGFCLFSTIVLGSSPIRVKLTRALPVFFAISLISELFWLSFIPILYILISIRGFSDWRKHKDALALFIGFSAVQILLGALNRILVFLGFGINRSFNASFLETTWLSLKLLPLEFTKAVIFPGIFWSLVIVSVGGLVVGGLFHPKKRVVAGVLVGAGLGALISVAIFALAGYRVESIGVFSRTTVVVSVWLSLIPALMVTIGGKFSPWMKRSLNAILLILLLILAISSLINVQAWKKSWEFQQALLNSIPAKELAEKATKDSFILVDADKPADAVEGLEAFWDLSGALFSKYPILRDRVVSSHGHQFAAIVDRSRKQTIWDGKAIIQSWCHSPDVVLWRLDAPSQVYLWNYANRQLTLVDRQVKMGCENSR